MARKNPAGTTIKPCRRQQGLSSGFPSHPYAELHGKLTSNGQLRENFFENICYVPQTILSAEWVPYLSPPPVTVCKRFTRRGEGTPPYGFLLRCAGGWKGCFGAASPPLREAPAVTALRVGRAPVVSFRCRPQRSCYTPAAPSGGGFAFLRSNH